MPPDWGQISSDLHRQAGIRVSAHAPESVAGGSINDCWRLSGEAGSYFLKLNGVTNLAMFEAEADGLEALRSAQAVRVPEVIGLGISGDNAYLLLEWINMGSGGSRSEALLGEQLARQHRVEQHDFGWKRDNFIGSTRQRNNPCSDWAAFFCEHRLGFQFELAARNGYEGRLQDRGKRLLELVPGFLSARQATASLLHGDLWGGNWATDEHQRPVIFDPAVYHGDRECDIAMTGLFGGFGRRFYESYHSMWPVEAGAGERAVLYNLYHVLNHLNLFGTGYLSQALRMIDRLLANL